jgi:hypothetical protein
MDQKHRELDCPSTESGFKKSVSRPTVQRTFPTIRSALEGTIEGRGGSVQLQVRFTSIQGVRMLPHLALQLGELKKNVLRGENLDIVRLHPRTSLPLFAHLYASTLLGRNLLLWGSGYEV